MAAGLGLALASASFAHQPEGVVYPVFQWPEGQEPIIDGDLWEWEVIPDAYHISSSICQDFHNGDPPEADGLESEIIVGWSESQNKIYILEVRQDDDFILGDPDTNGDAISIQLDGDHGGELITFRFEDEYTEEEQRLYNGRWAQSYHLPLQDSTLGPEDRWAWFWVSESTWYDQPDYMDMAYIFEGHPGGEGRLVTESSWTLWDEFIWNDPDVSVRTDLEEGDIIGLGWMYHDLNDEGGAAGFFCSGFDQWRTSDSISDFFLEPINSDVWGYLGCGEPYTPPDPPPCPCHELDDDSVVKLTSWRRMDAPSHGFNYLNHLTFSPDGNTLASSGADSTVRLWDVSTGTLRVTLQGHTDDVRTVAFSPDGHTLASGGVDDTIRLWDVRSGKPETRLTLHYTGNPEYGNAYSRGVLSLAFSPDDGTLVSGHSDGMLRFWNVRTGKLETSNDFGPNYASLAFSPDGSMLAGGRAGGSLHLYEVGPGGLQRFQVNFMPDGGAPKKTEICFPPEIPIGVGTVSFSPDGSKLAWGLEWGYGTRLWDRDSDQQITLRDTGYVAFSPDGLTLAIGHTYDPHNRHPGNTIIRLWGAETGQHKATLEGPPSKHNINSVAFSPDGTLASSSTDGTILLWDMPPFITDPSETTVVSAVEPAVPAASGLDAIAPNPFNTTTRISYRMASPGPVRLEIYNTLGQRVRTLVDEAHPAGSYQVLWEARDQKGAVVSAGVYLARLHYSDGAETRRLLFLK